MQKTRDLTLVVLFAVLSFAAWGTLGQLPVTLTGIVGISYAFLILHAIPQAVALMFFEGRRWRFFLMHTLFALLSLPTNLGGAPFDLTFRLPIIVTGLIADIVVNSFYKMAKRQDRLRLWITLGNAFRWGIDPFIGLVIFNLYLPVDIIALYLSFYVLLTPLVVAEGAVTGYIGYKIYNRVKKT